MTGGMQMTHPGLPLAWAALVWLAMLLISARALWVLPASQQAKLPWSRRIPLPGWVLRNPWTQAGTRLLVAAVFLIAIWAGLFGTPIPERNLATTLTWGLWWTGLIVSILFVGTVWCGLCPWDSLASWLVRRRWWTRGVLTNSLNLPVPRVLRSVWPALCLFVGLTWLELGLGITRSPYGTALVALLMVVLATTSLAVFERKAFCQYFCPVGRTIGFYAQLAPLELRAADPAVCASCQTLECYHGTERIEPCPTNLVIGKLKHNTFCTSCGSCARSCPHDNVAWRWRPLGIEARTRARARTDQTWFMLVLLSLTMFHGLTMLPFWEQWVSRLARMIGDTGQLLWSFSIGLVLTIAAVSLVYGACVWLLGLVQPQASDNKHLFTRMGFASLPLAFAYHLAHNLNHLSRESTGLSGVFANPLGTGTMPLSMQEQHLRHLHPLLPEAALHLFQAGLMIFGFFLAIEVLRHRLPELVRSPGRLVPGWRMSPALAFVVLVTTLNTALLMQPMIMRY